MTGGHEAPEHAGMAESGAESLPSSQMADPSFMGKLAIPLGMIACIVLVGMLLHIFG